MNYYFQKTILSENQCTIFLKIIHYPQYKLKMKIKNWTSCHFLRTNANFVS